MLLLPTIMMMMHVLPYKQLNDKSDPLSIPLTNPKDIPVLLYYSIFGLACTTNCSIPQDYLACFVFIY